MKMLNDKNLSLVELSKKSKETYQQGDPFPNIYFNDFFDEDLLNEVLSEFPDLAAGDTIKYNTGYEAKYAGRGERKFRDKTKTLMHFLNSEPFLEFLQELTGIKERLMPDPYFIGGGQHELKPGGFNKHQPTNLDRRLNVLIYLNKNWKDEYGGFFELWDRDMANCVKKILPTFNTMAIFSTTDFSYHGNPEVVKCPEGQSRKSLALYYYSNGRPAEEVNSGLEDHSTLFVARKGHGLDKEYVNKPPYTLKDFARDLTPPLIVKAVKSLVKY
jgi:hypothetical protein